MVLTSLRRARPLASESIVLLAVHVGSMQWFRIQHRASTDETLWHSSHIAA